MRFELALILWVTAIGSIVALFSPDVDQTWARNNEVLDDKVAEPASAVSLPVTSTHAATRIEGSRTIFASVMQPSMSPVEPEPGPEEVPMPELRGIVTVSGIRKAVFYDGTPEGRYVLVSIGETVGAIVIDTIDTDRVAGRAETGESKEFLLRADGEAGRP